MNAILRFFARLLGSGKPGGDYHDKSVPRYPWTAGPLAIFISPEIPTERAALIRKSLHRWNNALAGRFAILDTISPDGAQIRYAIGDPATIGGEAHNAAGTKRHQVETPYPRFVADVVFRPELLDSEFAECAEHETGHALGVVEHSAEPGDAMFVGVNGRTGLTARDEKTIRRVYGVENE